MTLDYVLTVAVIGVPLAILIMRFGGVIALMYEILASMWMLPI